MPARKAEQGEVTIRVETIDQLFNSFDPSPFHEKHLDAHAEITSSAGRRKLRTTRRSASSSIYRRKKPPGRKPPLSPTLLPIISSTARSISTVSCASYSASTGALSPSGSWCLRFAWRGADACPAYPKCHRRARRRRKPDPRRLGGELAADRNLSLRLVADCAPQTAVSADRASAGFGESGLSAPSGVNHFRMSSLQDAGASSHQKPHLLQPPRPSKSARSATVERSLRMGIPVRPAD